MATVLINCNITISNFKATINGLLLSSEKSSLYKKPGSTLTVWHRGKTTKLISASTNKIRFQSDFYIRKNVIGLKTTIHPTVIMVGQVTFNKSYSSLLLSYQAADIKKIPNGLEKMFKLNKIRKTKINIPAKLHKLKAKGKPMILKLSKIGSGGLKISIGIPIESNKLSIV